jgi:hypothetical protein
MDLRITKYDPIYRDAEGRFTKNEWTSFSDVGKEFDGQCFELSQYYEIESRYIQAIDILLTEGNATNITIREIEKNGTNEKMDQLMLRDYLQLHDNQVIDKTRLRQISKLILREYIWCKLVTDVGLSITFGYDYYMYFHLINISQKVINNIRHRIQLLGLFVD